MRTEFREALLPKELRSLVLFDRKAFHAYPADWFDAGDWRCYQPWWMLVGGRKAGCCAFAPHLNFREDISADGENRTAQACLYIATTAVLPAFRGQGFGSLLKCWQISYARHHGFTRMVTNTRRSNKAMIGLNKKFGFKTLRITGGYYAYPEEPTVVMELRF